MPCNHLARVHERRACGAGERMNPEPAARDYMNPSLRRAASA
jgi:hypothetical protein